jgi:hypothetical protein
MSSEESKPPEPSKEPAQTGQPEKPEKKLTFFERLIQKTAKVLRQSR